MKKITLLLALPLFALLFVTACASKGAGEEISRERAIELAREHIDFEPGNVEAVQDTEEGRPVWRVTFYAKGVDAAHPGQVSFVVLDRRTGEVISFGMS